MLTMRQIKRHLIRKSICQNRLKMSDIKQFYVNHNSLSYNIGIEYERLSLDCDTLRNASYSKVSKIIQQFAISMDWDLLLDNDTIIGAFCYDGTSVTLEPGCQLEISLAPSDDILQIDCKLSKIVAILDSIARTYNVMFLGYGISPLDDVEDIELLNKSRYKIMDRYLPYSVNGELSQKMMRKTAGIQINIDYNDNFDAYNKLKFFNLISPFMMALCANSPFENNSMTDMKSQRANVWFYTGDERCNNFYKEIFKNPISRFDVVDRYINKILDVPMIFIERNNKQIPINGKITFREFLKNGYYAYHALYEDYVLHQSLCFPNVRLKRYIEIRNHDSSNLPMALALCAFYKGLINVSGYELLNKFNYLKIDNLDKYYKDAAKFGLDFRVNRKIHANDVLKRLLDIVRVNLTSSERVYIEPINKIILTGSNQADIIIKNKINDAFALVNLLNNITK